MFIWLVVWNMTGLFYPYIGNVIIPTDELIFFRGVGTPPTSYEYPNYVMFQHQNGSTIPNDKNHHFDGWDCGTDNITF